MNGYVAPMLAARQPNNIDAYFDRHDWLMEPKFDGHRVIVHIDKKARVYAWSRPKEPRAMGAMRQLPPHIVQALQSFPRGAFPATFDSELIVPDGACWDAQAKNLDPIKQLAIFDTMLIMGRELTSSTLTERKNCLGLVAGSRSHNLYGDAISFVYPVPTSRKSLEAIWDSGGEGAILKRRDSRYMPGCRLLTGWIKVKRQFKEIGKIVGFKKGKRGAFSTVIAAVDGELIEAKAQPDLFAYGAKAIGMMILIRHSGLTPSGRRQHPQAYFNTRG